MWNYLNPLNWDRWTWSHFVWYVVWIGIVFLPAELLGEWRISPWVTFSETVQHDVAHHEWFAIFALGAIVGLAVHFMFDRTLGPALLFGMILSVAAHLLDKAWP